MNINLINFWKFARPFILGLAVIFLGYLAQTTTLPLAFGQEGSEPPIFCPTGQLISSIPECQGQQQCTRDYLYGDSCQQVKDKLYDCKYVYGKCGYYGSTTTPPSQPAAPAPTNVSCDSLVTNRICGGQPAYDTCTLKYDGNRAYYDCYASKNSNCQGKIYCGLYDKPFAQVPVYPSNVDSSGQVVAPTCDSVATTTNYCPGVETYDTCSLRYVGNKAYYDCKASQNTNCQGTIACPAKNRTTTTTTTQPEQPTQQIVNCPQGTVPQAGTQNQNTIVCVAQNNDQRTDQNNNQDQSNNQNVSVSSSSSATGGSANVTVTGGGTTSQVIREVQTFGNVGVVQGVKELPKTGLPVLAWAALAFIPAGFKIRSFSKVKEQASAKPHFLWEERQFKTDLDN